MLRNFKCFVIWRIYCCVTFIEMGECYVCYDACYSLSPCKCTDLYLCNNCYAKLILYNNTKCTVCSAPYPPSHLKVVADVEEEMENEEEEELKIGLMWFFVPIMMRPHPFTTFPNKHLDVLLDVGRSSFCILICTYFVSVARDESPFETVVNAIYGLLLFLFFSIMIRHSCAIR